MRIIRKKSTPIDPQSPPQDMNLQAKNKSQKATKDQASKTISQNTISAHIKRAIEGITPKIEKTSIEKIIMDAETDEGCDCLIQSFIDVLDNNSNNDTVILKSLEVIYILLFTSNSTFRTKMQFIMPEILTITTLNFKKYKVKFRSSVHELAKAIYLNLQRNTPLPSPVQLGLPENFSQFIPISSCRNGYDVHITENKSSFDFENENDNYNVPNNLDINEETTANNLISDMVDSSPKNQSSFNLNNDGISLIANHNVPNKNNIDDDLIDCEDANDIKKENANLINDSIAKNNKIENSMIEINDTNQHPSNAKQVLDDYLKNNGANNDNTINPDNSDNKKSYDNLLLMPDESFGTSSSVVYTSADLTNSGQSKNVLNSNINSSKDIIENLLDPESTNTRKTRRQKTNFKISTEKSDLSSSPNIPRSQSLNVNMPLVIDQNINSNLTSGSQLIPNTHNSSSREFIDPNQIIDLTKPASTPNSPTTSLMGTTQNSLLDSILNSQPNTSPTQNYNSPSTFNPPSASTFNPPSSSTFNPPSSSTFNPSSDFNSSELTNQESLNSISDSILKIPSKEMISPSKSSTIQIFDLPSNSNIRLESSSSNIIFNLNSIQETKKPSSSRFSVKYEPKSSSNLLNKEENSQNNLTQQKKKNFKIEKRISSPQSDNSEPISISQTESPADSSFTFSPKYESDNTSNFSNTASNNFSDQELFGSSIQTSTNDDFQASKPSFGLEDFDDQFEPITPVQSSSIQIFNDNKNNATPPASILTTSEENNNTKSEQFIPITPTRNSVSQSNNEIDDGFVPITPIHTANLDLNDDKNSNNNQNNNTESDDQFVPITPVRNSLNFLDDDDLFTKSKSEGGSFNSDQFVPITPVKDNQIFTSDDQFVPITPVKNSIDPIFDEDNNSNESDNRNISNNNPGSFDQFIPLSPSLNKDIISFSDGQAQNLNNKNKNEDNLYDQLISIPKNDNNNDINNNNNQGQNQNSNSDNSLYDQFVPISPVAESIMPIFGTSNFDSNGDNSFHSIMRNKRNNISGSNNNFNANELMGNSPRSRRHLSFDSGIFSPGSASDKFEPITPPNARSMFYTSQNNNNNINNLRNEEDIRTIPISKPKNPDPIVTVEDDKSDSKMTDSSFIDQFEPITPPSSIQNRSQIEDLINSANNNSLNQNEIIFTQANKNDSKFDENLDKKLNYLNNKNGSRHLVSFETTKQRKNSDAQQNGISNFDLFDSVKDPNRDTNSDINFELLGANNFSKSHEHIRNENNVNSPSNKSQNPIDVKATVSKNNQANRFNVYIERMPSSQKIITDNDN